MTTHSSATVVPFGAQAALVTATDAAQARVIGEHLRTVLGEQVSSVVPGADTVLVHAHPAATDITALVQSALDQPVTLTATQSAMVTLPVRYDGEDLSLVADLLGVSVSEVIARHTAPLYTVDFLGFAPGFPYLSGLDPFLAEVPRLDTPRTRVPAGSVGLAAGRTCVYPSVSPGGWRLLGSTDTTLFDPTNTAAPALLSPGTRVRFEQVG